MPLEGRRGDGRHRQPPRTVQVRSRSLRSTTSRRRLNCCKDWWPGTESNRRHADFQSAALPAELPGRGAKRQFNHGGPGTVNESGPRGRIAYTCLTTSFAIIGGEGMPAPPAAKLPKDYD